MIVGQAVLNVTREGAAPMGCVLHEKRFRVYPPPPATPICFWVPHVQGCTTLNKSLIITCSDHTLSFGNKLAMCGEQGDWEALHHGATTEERVALNCFVFSRNHAVYSQGCHQLQD